jgi:hypothetical protein
MRIHIFTILLLFSTATQKKLPSGFHTIPIWGTDDLKYYFTVLYIGSPPQRQSVIIDTGSNYLAFPCSKCKPGQCGSHEFPALDLAKDSAAKPLKCGATFKNFKCNSCDRAQHCTFSNYYMEGDGVDGQVYTSNINILAPTDMQDSANVKKHEIFSKKPPA